MKKFYFLILLILLSCEDNFIEEKFDSAEIVKTIILPKKINETSGLEFYENNFITHNDSGDGPYLYVFDENGNIFKTLDLNNYSNFEIENNDWEDITSDGKYFYVADVGNNFGNRSDLNIIRINKDNNYSVDGIIEIFYADQETFFPRPVHKYDAEAVVVVNGQLMLFSKDRLSLNSDLYLIDKFKKEPQRLTSEVSFNVNSKITGGDYNNELDLLALVGYRSNGDQYLVLFESFNLENLKENTFKKYKIPLERAQIESIKIIDKYTFWVTSEDEGLGNPFMYKLKIKY